MIAPPPCPACGSTDVVELIWGMPGFDAVERMAGRQVDFRGCVIPEDPADFHCESCHHEWGDPQYQD